jgi:hypothetical protein
MLDAQRSPPNKGLDLIVLSFSVALSQRASSRKVAMIGRLCAEAEHKGYGLASPTTTFGCWSRIEWSDHRFVRLSNISSAIGMVRVSNESAM